MLSDLNEFAVEEDITNLEIIGGYSVDGNRQYHNDLTQLKYYKEPPNINKVNFNLNSHNETIFRTNVNPKLDFVLTWMSENFDTLKIQDSKSMDSSQWLEPDFVCHRGILKSLLLTPYENFFGWIICASKFKGTIYLCSFETDYHKNYELTANNYQRNSTRWGYKFEQFMLSDSPFSDPDTSAPLNENEEFCLVFKSKFGDFTLLYGAEIDGIHSQEIVKDTVRGKELKLIELKTTLNYRPFKRLTWWAQSYLVGIQNIICGCKNTSGIINRIQKLGRKQLEYNLQDKQKRCKSFLNAFLKRMKTVCKEDNILYKFTNDPIKKTITTEEMNPTCTSEYTFLHSWYIKNLEDFKNGIKT